MTMWRIEFDSDKFLPFLPEKAQVNPGAYGFELAAWLTRGLMSRGVVSSYPNCEDWGWFIDFADHGDEIMIGCSSMSDYEEGYKDKPITWSIFVKPYKRLFRKPKPSAELAAKTLGDHITALLDAEGIAWRAG